MAIDWGEMWDTTVNTTQDAYSSYNETKIAQDNLEAQKYSTLQTEILKTIQQDSNVAVASEKASFDYSDPKLLFMGISALVGVVVLVKMVK